MVNRLPTIADEFVGFRDAVDRLFGEGQGASPYRGLWSGTWGNGTARTALPLDVYATKDEVFVIGAVPGVSAGEIEISINQNVISVSGKIPNVAASEEAKDATWYLHELPHGSFQRTVTLPVEVNAARADATFENGILRLRLPKSDTA